MKFIIKSNPSILEVISDVYPGQYAAMSELLECAKAHYKTECFIYAWNNSFWAEVEADSSKAALEAFELRFRLLDLLDKLDNVVDKMEVEDGNERSDS